MNVLLTGATGLVGKQLLPALAKLGRVTALVRRTPSRLETPGPQSVEYVEADLRDYAALYETLGTHKVEVVVHSAAISHPGPSFRRPMTTVQINFDATVALLEAARLFGVRRFVYISSIGVYGPYQHPLVDETHPVAGNSPYGVTKAASEMMGNMYETTYGLRFVSLRYAHVYGPDREMACPIKMLVDAAVANLPLKLDSGADARLNLVYQNDVVQPVMVCLRKDPSYKAYNIADGVVCTLRDVLNILRKKFPSWEADVGPGNLPQSATGLPPEQGGERGIDISRARSDLGFEPQFDLASALDDYTRALTSRQRS